MTEDLHQNVGERSISEELRDRIASLAHADNGFGTCRECGETWMCPTVSPPVDPDDESTP